MILTTMLPAQVLEALIMTVFNVRLPNLNWEGCCDDDINYSVKMCNENMIYTLDIHSCNSERSTLNFTPRKEIK